ncbi:MAG: DUF1553 domain-containing protein [Planctomycetota bacterium]
MTDRRASHALRATLTSTIVAIYLSCNLMSASADEELQFNRDIRPILADHCFSCHGLDEASREADLRLDQRDAAVESGAIVPQASGESEMIARILSDDADTLMPPPEFKKPLSREEIELLRRWVDEGATYQKHWAFMKPERPETPRVSEAEWPKNEIDYFVLSRLEREQLAPAEEAAPNLLFRRLHLDVTGLPPKPEDVTEFAKAFEAEPEATLSAWIDRLMATDAWGEHRGRFWLDAARYADTHGMHFDNYREMWPYRDWVIRAFNRNQPFDEFTVEQLAGDLLDNPTLEQQIATGFQRCNITTNEGGTIEAENLALYASDRVQTFGWVYLGLTTNCCQCHDHKFDPLTQEDYYSLAAFFRNTTQTGLDGNVKDGRGPAIRVPMGADRERWAVIDEEIAAAERAREQYRGEAKAPFEKWLESIEADDIRANFPEEARVVSVPLDEGAGGQLAVLRQFDVRRVEAAEPDWSVEGRFTKALQLGPNKTLELGQIGDYSRAQAFTHTEWIWTANLKQTAAVLARMDEANNHRGWDLYFENGELAVHLIDSWPDNAIKVRTNKAGLKAKQWHHVAVTWDGSGKPEGVTIYIDGEKRSTRVVTKSLKEDADIKTETPFRIGQRSTGSTFNGSLQDLHVFNEALDQGQIKQVRLAGSLARILEMDSADRSEVQTSQLFDYYLEQYDQTYVDLAAAATTLRGERDAIAARSPVTHVQVERDQPAMANILLRGEYDNIGDEVTARPPAALHAFPEEAPTNRLGLAKWVVDPANPLTARVTVNRFWQELFGQGIVATPEDFGIMGAPPSNPELLDWLALDFIESGWDVKRFFKQVLMSATYRQAAVITPEKLAKDRDNVLQSRGPRFRMDAEMVRDFALSVSSLRSGKMYGPGVRPYQPDNLWNMVGLPGGDTRVYRQDTGENLYRRSLYTFWKRMSPPPGLETLGAPNREVCTVRRERTNTPLQALVTLNDPQYVEAARTLAALAMESGEAPQTIANEIAQQVLSREWSDRELKLVLATYQDFSEHYASHEAGATALTNVGESPSSSAFDVAELAAWTMVSNQIMNLDEALNK